MVETKKQQRELTGEQKQRKLEQLLENYPEIVLKQMKKNIKSVDFATMLYDGLFIRGGSKEQEIKVENLTTKYLTKLGIPRHIKGFGYIRTAMVICVKDSNVLDSVTKCLYPDIAKIHKTTASGVERSIRYAIELAWTRGIPENLEETFGYTVSRDKRNPTNSEFLAILTDEISRQLH